MKLVGTADDQIRPSITLVLTSPSLGVTWFDSIVKNKHFICYNDLTSACETRKIFL